MILKLFYTKIKVHVLKIVKIKVNVLEVHVYVNKIFLIQIAHYKQNKFMLRIKLKL